MKIYQGNYKKPLSELGLENRVSLVQSRNQEGKDITSFFPGSEGKLFLIHSPELIREVLGKRHETFVEDKHPYASLAPVFSSSGRDAVLLARESGSTPLSFVGPAVSRYADALSAQIVQEPEQDVFPIFSRMILEIMGEALFGFEMGRQAERFFLASMQHEDFLSVSRRGGPNATQEAEALKRNIQTALMEQEAVAMEIVEARRLNGAEIPQIPRGIPIGRAIVRTLLNAYAGTATTLSWVVLMLARYPDIQDRLRTESQGVELDTDLARQPEMARVIKETLRLFPTAWMMSRTCLEETRLGDTIIPKGAAVFVCTYTLHRDRKLWPEPEEFRPDRFLKGEFGDGPPYSYLPFGAGPHRCPGMRFSLETIQTCVGRLLREFRFEQIPGLTIKPFPRVALQPEPGAWVRITALK